MTTLDTSLRTLDADCESAAETEYNKLLKDARNGGANCRPPSPQAVEAIWLKLIAKKEYEFIQEIDNVLASKSADQAAAKPAISSKEDIAAVEETIDELLADDRYLERMQDFYEVARKTAPDVSSSNAQAKRLDL